MSKPKEIDPEINRLNEEVKKQYCPETEKAISDEMLLPVYKETDSVKKESKILKEILKEEDFSVSIIDRQTKETIFTAQGCRVTGWSSGVASRGVSDIRLDVIGIVAWDESVKSDEDVGASNLTDR